MPKPSAQVTAAEISRLAGVTRATVSNWRRRHADFPAPASGTDTSPLYDLEAIRAWLDSRGHGTAASSIEELRAALRLHTGSGGAPTRLLPLVLASAQRDREALTALGELPDGELAARCHDAVAELADTVPGAETVTYSTADAAVLRALLHCVRDEGGQAALDVLAERELEDSAASGAYQTPKQLADLMARLLTPHPDGPYPARVLDPACGSGTLLTTAAQHGATGLFAQDLLPVQAQRTAVRLRLAAPEADVTVRAGDTLRADAFPDLIADAVLCNPPYADRDWGHDELAYDPRWAYGVPPRAESELAWVQHALAHLMPGAVAVMLLPPATASRTSGRRVRAELLRSGALRAVVSLPPGAATPLHIGLQLWILQRPEPGGGDRQTVLFIDAAGEQRPHDLPTLHGSALPTTRSRGGRAPLDWTALSTAALDHWQAFAADPAGFTDHPGTACAVPVVDLLDDLVDITPTRHVRVTAPVADPTAVAKNLRQLEDRLKERALALADASAHTAWTAAEEESRSWRTATVSDLARGGALTVHRAVPAGRGSQDTPLPPEHAGLSTLTGRDLARGSRASGDPDEQHLAGSTVIEAGDVLIPGIRAAQGVAARVADDGDAGCLLGLHIHLIRPDPDRLDPWFLAGFLSAEDNVNSASTGSTSLHVDPRRLRVPLLPLDEQRRYGLAFRQLHMLRALAYEVAELTEETNGLLTQSLTSGVLLPPEVHPG
ncbi:N-6 DNA methylase [Streptomyces mirabilis]|uniref:N-6 DNA methylase n=1 Tax=Streptomyces mirabilis TaxID=68239 RepID=UPI002258DBCA|nr:N-6 DNA methylase [Streptomyces mirabilis]MCX4429585.1 N-6 DNA methylase [Streptomyces mirabilis]